MSHSGSPCLPAPRLTVTLFVLWCAATVGSGLAQAAERKGSDPAAALRDRVSGIRDVPARKRGETIRSLARDIRALPASASQVELGAALAFVSTEGDFGAETLQGVTDMLEQFINATPPTTSTNTWAAPAPILARLVHFEGVSTKVATPEFQAELQRLQENDRRLADVDFTLNDLDGRAWHLRELRGKVVLVNFWATWCPPCRAELPDLKALAREHARDLVVLGISSEPPADLKPFVKKQSIPYPILVDATTNVSTAFGVEGIPRTVIFDRNGKLAAQAADMRTRRQLDAMLAKAGLTAPNR